ncbi:MAG: glucosyl-3-phosphoglycerate synthase [Actinomycetes bacterium]
MADVRTLRLTSDLDAENLIAKKAGRTISVCIPARNEAATIAPILLRIKRELMDAHPLVDQLIVMDHESTDQTAEVARECGATVIDTNCVLGEFGPALGKGDVLWRSVEASTGDIIVWLDADLASFTPQYVTALVEPLLTDDSIALVRANYQRTLHGEGDGGGRVTELTARPVLKLLYPELAHIRQPLGGEYAIRRDVALAVPFEIDYGVEIGLLIDVSRAYGVESITQAELGARTHRNRPLSELHEQAIQVLRSALARKSALAMDADATIRPALDSINQEEQTSASGE